MFGALQLWSGRQRAQHFATKSALFQQFQAPALGEWLSRDPGFLLEPVRQNASIVFIDLSGFTALSETLGADAVRELLKDFHALVDNEATAHGGIVTSFPRRRRDDPVRAAAPDCRRRRQRRARAAPA